MSITESIRYGAAELKRFYNHNLGLALVVSVGLHLGLIGLYLVTANLQAHDEPPYTGGPIVLGPIAPPHSEEHPVVPPQTGGHPGPVVLVDPTGTGALPDNFGQLVAVPDNLVTDSTSIASFDKLSIAPSQPGSGNGFGPSGDSGQFGVNAGRQPSAPMNIVKAEEIPPVDDFIAVEKDPEFDMAELMKRVKYPEIARRNSIEGKVVVQAFVDKTGRVARTQIAQSDNKILEAAAVDAVMHTRFAPAEQNGSSVGVWIAIPITFRLD